MSLSCTVSEIARYRSKIGDFNLPNLYLAPPLGVTSELCVDFWRQKTRIHGLLCGIVCVILRLAVLIQCWLVTDGWTDGHMMTAYTVLA